MSEFLFFIIGTMLGGLFGVVCMCCLQINRLSERKEVDNVHIPQELRIRSGGTERHSASN